ncbi:hypothetical protein [Cedecea lapagei]|uniref:hypothetical protein n=1 Tax=Cedecea lapagei TaxID=158823 RepID=UPI001BD120A4|nr:hypothetical protein [Cedecea lapagei]
MSVIKNIIWPCITVIVICVAWVLINADKVIDNIDKFKSWHGSSAALEGRWNNSTEYDLDPPSWLVNQKDFVEVRITIENSRMDGTITSDALKKVIPFEYVLLEGKKRAFRDTIDAEAFDFIGGKRVSFGRFLLTLKGDALIVDALDDVDHVFPKESMLIKKSKVAFPGLKKMDSEEEHGDEHEQPPIFRSNPDQIDGKNQKN